MCGVLLRVVTMLVVFAGNLPVSFGLVLLVLRRISGVGLVLCFVAWLVDLWFVAFCGVCVFWCVLCLGGLVWSWLC